MTSLGPKSIGKRLGIPIVKAIVNVWHEQMSPLETTKILLMTSVFALFPYSLETDFAGKIKLVESLALAKDGSDDDDDDDDGGEGGGDDDDDDGGEGGDDDDSGEDDSDDDSGGEGGDDSDDDGGDSGEGDDDGSSSDSGEDGDDDDGGSSDSGENDDDEDGDGNDDSDDADADSGEGDDDDSESDRKARRVIKAQKLGDGARIFFSDGSREEIRNGRYVRIGPNGRVLERRRARGSDLGRVRALIGGKETKLESVPSRVQSRAVRATYRGKNVEILYANGWREEITRGRYSLVDKYGRNVTSRRATQNDRTRLDRFRSK